MTEPAPTEAERRADRTGTVMVVAITLVSGGLCYGLKGPEVFFATFAADARMLLDLLPRMAVAMLLAGGLFVLLPRRQVARWLGAGSGIRGLVLAGIAGMLTPGGPMTSFPMAAVMIGAGADIGAAVTYVTAWMFLGVTRMLVWEIPFMGADFAMLRFAVSLALPILAGLIARRLPVTARIPAAGD